MLAHLLDTIHLIRLAHTTETVQMGLLRHQLGEILVGRHHQHLIKTLLLGPHRCCADDVVGLITFTRQHRDAECIKHLMNIWYGSEDILRRGITVGLVGLVHLMTERRGMHVESHSHVGGMLLTHQVVERGSEPQDSRRIQPLGIQSRRAVQRIIGPKDNGHAIQQH